MIDIQTILLIAQSTSVLATIVGIISLISIARVTNHLESGSFREIFSSLGIFFLVTLIGVASMTIYHFLYGNEELAENAEQLWYTFMFTSLVISVYGSYIAIRFGKSINQILKRVTHKKNKKR